MNSINFIFIFTLFLIVSATVKKSYEGYTLYNIVPKNDSDVKILEEIRANNLADFWHDAFIVNQETKAMVSPESQEAFFGHLKTGNIEAIIALDDVQRAIDDQLKPAIIKSQSYLSYSWNEYHNLETINKWLDELVEAHPSVAKTVIMGKSVEDKDIKGIIINHRPERQRPLIGMLEGTLHAREWISTATVTWIIKEFLTSNNTDIRALAENFEWHIFPVINPDGYVYTFTHNRMWRKNRSPENFRDCGTIDDDMSNGVDLNRNFDFEWMTIGASQDPCNNQYAGPRAFSEPEARAIAQYVQALNGTGDFIFYLAMHSFSQLIVIPYSHVLGIEGALLSRNYPDMYEAAIRGVDALQKRYGSQYRVGLSATVLYPMSGTSFDWVKYAVDVPMTFLIELRDLGTFGFLLPPQQIIPTSLEMMDAIVEMGKATSRMRYFEFQNVSGANSVIFSTSIMLLGVLIALFQ